MTTCILWSPLGPCECHIHVHDAVDALQLTPMKANHTRPRQLCLTETVRHLLHNALLSNVSRVLEPVSATLRQSGGTQGPGNFLGYLFAPYMTSVSPGTVTEPCQIQVDLSPSSGEISRSTRAEHDSTTPLPHLHVFPHGSTVARPGKKPEDISS